MKKANQGCSLLTQLRRFNWPAGSFLGASD
jgi:hypothetical protein